MRYVDTSVLVAALTRERHGVDLVTWLADNADDCAISNWSITEFSSAISIKVRTGALTEAEQLDVLITFDRLGESLEAIPIRETDFARAAILANDSSSGLRAGDALHLAIGEASDCVVVTLDRRMANAGRKHHIGVELLGSPG